jgi:AraC family transcriptional regulator
MTASEKPSNPDFLVRWQSASEDFVTVVNCGTAEQNCADASKQRLRKPVARLLTATVAIEVSDLSWSTPTTITLIPYRPGFSMVASASSATLVEYGYGGAAAQQSRVGHVLFIVPGNELSGSGEAGAFRTITCSFDPAYAEGILGPLHDLSEEQLNGALNLRSALIAFILLRLMNEAMYPGPVSDAVVESLGQALLVECAHWLLSEKSKPEGRGSGALTAQHFARIEEYLADLSGKLPSVAELASVCGFSQRHFAKLFRAQTNCSVAQYIKAFQIAKAKAYLLETELPLKEIAYRLGFSTPANFSSAFRAATGMTPGAVRKSDR